jgi:predicted nucleic acid-binding protein
MQRSLVCVDASIIISLVTSEAQSQKVLNLWTKWMQEDIHVFAPSLLRYEVTSALRRKVVRGIMSYEDARRSLETALSLDIEFLDQPELSLRAYDIAFRFDLPTAYDAYYLAAAEILECEFWTSDKRLYNAVSGSFHNLCWIG